MVSMLLINIGFNIHTDNVIFMSYVIQFSIPIFGDIFGDV